MLQLADLVKFAKLNPLPNDHTRCMRYAIEFVNNTKQLIDITHLN